MTGLTAGVTYQFRVQSRNSFSLSADSNTLQVLCAFVPYAPAAPTTTVVNENLLLEWTAPTANGSPLLAYRVEIEQADGTFSEELTSCDGSEYFIFTMTACTIPLATLRADPFLLTMGTTIRAQIVAINEYGESDYSAIGGTALMVNVPDAPESLQNDLLVTDAFQIGIKWVDGPSTGG